MRTFTLGDFDFALPPELVAQHPAAERSGSRLLDGTQAQPADRVFRDLPSLLRAGDHVRLGWDSKDQYFFDRQTGMRRHPQ